MKLSFFSQRVDVFSKYAITCMLSTTLTLSFIPNSVAEISHDSDSKIEQASVSPNESEVKTDLIRKLSQIQYINAEFTQVVVNDLGEVLQEGQGKIAISKPDLVNWHTTAPDETLIISNGNKLWFYDPFIEQVSLYSFEKSIANTPVLLLTSENPTLWNDFEVSKNKSNQYLIKSLNTESQIKSLTLTFINQKLDQLSIIDSTGQTSHIQLLNVDFASKPNDALFNFIVPEGVMIDDQR